MSDEDPFVYGDRAERPRPGAGARRPSGATPRSPAAAPATEGSGVAIPAVLGLSANPLVEAASPLLLLTAQLRSTQTAMDVAGLRRQALEEIGRFEERAARGGVQREIVIAARYALCAGLDEAVLSTPWGSQSEWTQHSLLVTLHREMWGGEKFFDMLDRISADPDRHINLLELQYIELALGFTGKYHDQGQDKLADLQHRVYRTIQQRRRAPEDQLSPQWRGLDDRRNRLIRYVPWWVMSAALLGVLSATFGMYRLRLEATAEPLEARLATIGADDLAETPPVPSPPVAGPTLKQLLKPEEDAGRMQVVETGTRTVVTLVGGDLFRSGSAAVNPVYQEAIERIADALNRIPGRVQIIGHTDDQRIQSLTFHNNTELSRERAVTVANALKARIDNPARLSAIGLGDSKPLYLPQSTPENRARNRRVEIIHVRG
jgi:type VI secretion system protein ImpK